MCLAIPAKVVEIAENDQAIVDLGGVRKDVSLALVEDVQVGDYVIVHVGYALTRLDPEEAEKTLALMAEAGCWSSPGMSRRIPRRRETIGVREQPLHELFQSGVFPLMKPRSGMRRCLALKRQPIPPAPPPPGRS
jgi:hydrogenase expression/formation protein HypC